MSIRNTRLHISGLDSQDHLERLHSLAVILGEVGHPRAGSPPQNVLLVLRRGCSRRHPSDRTRGSPVAVQRRAEDASDVQFVPSACECGC